MLQQMDLVGGIVTQMNALSVALCGYIDFASDVLTCLFQKVGRGGGVDDLEHVARIRHEVGKLEADARFNTFVAEVDSFLLAEHRAAYGQPDPTLSLGQPPEPPASLRDHVRCFLRLTGTYLSISRNEPVDCDNLLSLLVREVRRDAILVKELVPLEGVKLSLAHDVSFGDSVLVRAGSALHVWEERAWQTARLFFPEAVIDENIRMFDLVIQQKVWSPARLTQSVGRFGPGNWVLKLDFYAPFRRFPRGHGEEIEQDIDALRLFDWTRFMVPWRDSSMYCPPAWGTKFQAHDSLLYPPFPGQSGSRIGLVEDDDDSMGNFLGHKRSNHLELDDTATAELARFVTEIAALRRRVATVEGWRFVERALHYVRKAELNEGFDQFLFLVVAVDALFGEPGPGLTKKLTRRWAAVLGHARAERNAKKQEFSEFYRLRSKYVHGDEGDEQINSERLVAINREVREAVMRVLRWLGVLLDAQLPAAPSRSSLFAYLDAAEGGDLSKLAHAHVLAQLASRTVSHWFPPMSSPP